MGAPDASRPRHGDYFEMDTTNSAPPELQFQLATPVLIKYRDYWSVMQFHHTIPELPQASSAADFDPEGISSDNAEGPD